MLFVTIIPTWHRSVLLLGTKISIRNLGESHTRIRRAYERHSFKGLSLRGVVSVEWTERLSRIPRDLASFLLSIRLNFAASSRNAVNHNMKDNQV
jgi:hypothetical protein